MLSKNCNQKLCLFSILLLLLWGTISGASSASEITDAVCGQQYSYVNHSVSAITPAGRHIPTQAYLSARYTAAQESLSTARGRNVRPLSRTARHITAVLILSGLFAASFSVFRRLSNRLIPAFCSCGIIITNYIHKKDGRKSVPLFTQLY